MSESKQVMKGVERFIDKSKPRRLLLACVLIESFEKFPIDPCCEPLSWFMIVYSV